MFNPIRAVSPRIQSRCPSCHCFVRIDQGTCTACGLAFALVAGTRRAETRLDQDECFSRPSRFEVQGEAFQNGPLAGNAQFSNLQPDGKIKKSPKKKTPDTQMNLFQGVL